jgi:hypothetical protein
MSDVETKSKREEAADTPATVRVPEPAPRETPRCRLRIPRRAHIGVPHRRAERAGDRERNQSNQERQDARRHRVHATVSELIPTMLGEPKPL